MSRWSPPPWPVGPQPREGDLARTVRSGDWSAAHAIADCLSVDVTVTAYTSKGPAGAAPGQLGLKGMGLPPLAPHLEHKGQ